MQQLRSMVHEIVGRINGHYGTLTHVPIHHLDRQLSFHELCALYAITDVLLVTSLRDGMNLVSYEYVACQSDNAGNLLITLAVSLSWRAVLLLVTDYFTGAAYLLLSISSADIFLDPLSSFQVDPGLEDNMKHDWCAGRWC